MLALKTLREINWDDMPNIEHPFFAGSAIRNYFNGSIRAEPIWGLTEALDDCLYGQSLCNLDRRDDELALQPVIEALERGQFF